MTRDPQSGGGRAVGSLLNLEIAAEKLHPFSSVLPLRGFSNWGRGRRVLINGLLSVSVHSAALYYGEAPYFIECLRYELSRRKKASRLNWRVQSLTVWVSRVRHADL